MITFTIPAAEVQPALDYHRIVECIEHVEGHSWSFGGGALGWTVAAWMEDAGGRPFSHAKIPHVSRAIAVRRLERLTPLMTRAGYSLTVRNIAQLWRSGLAGVTSGNPREPGYGIRVANLYFDRR